MLLTVSEQAYFWFYLVTICFLISVTASFLSNIGSTGMSGLHISEAASFACLSANLLPSISLCPGTQCTMILLFFLEFYLGCS